MLPVGTSAIDKLKESLAGPAHCPSMAEVRAARDAWASVIERAFTQISTLQNLVEYQQMFDDCTVRDFIAPATRSQLEPKARRFSAAIIGLSAVGTLLDAVGAQCAQWENKNVFVRKAEEDQLARTLAQRLTGPSVELPPEALPVERWELDKPIENARFKSPDDLYSEAVSAFQEIRDKVAEVKAVIDYWQPRLEQADADIAAVAALAKELNIVPAGVANAQLQLDAWRRQVFNDPLGPAMRPPRTVRAGDSASPTDIALQTNIAAHLGQARRELEQLKLQHDGFPGRMNEAESLLAAIRSIREKSQAAHDEAVWKVRNPLPRDLPGGKIVASLAHRLEIFRRMPPGEWRAVAAAVRGWHEDAARARGEEQAVLDFNQGLLAHRRQFRGLLEASRARALKYKLADQTELKQTYNELQPLLYSNGSRNYRACDLVYVERRVDEYADKLRMLMASRSTT